MNGRFIIVAEDIVKELIDNQRQILATLLEKDSINSTLGDYVPESEAKKLLNRKTTWFWKMRSEGRLNFAKVGNQIFYRRSDLEELLNESLQQL